MARKKGSGQSRNSWFLALKRLRSILDSPLHESTPLAVCSFSHERRSMRLLSRGTRDFAPRHDIWPRLCDLASGGRSNFPRLLERLHHPIRSESCNQTNFAGIINHKQFAIPEAPESSKIPHRRRFPGNITRYTFKKSIPGASLKLA